MRPVTSVYFYASWGGDVVPRVPVVRTVVQGRNMRRGAGEGVHVHTSFRAIVVSEGYACQSANAG